jgi:tricarballylate dehydrogenase
VTREIMAQPEGLAFAVFDAGLDDVDNWQATVRSRMPPYQAASFAELAALMGVEPVLLEETVADFNAACPASGDFDPLQPDGLATRDLLPRKSNWARPLLTPPFRAWPMICSNCFTFGGVKVDHHARVINAEGDAIPGLYAAGEVVGLYYRTYTGATSVMRGAVTGRLAGADAARQGNAPN